jgi:hypothetical protein
VKRILLVIVFILFGSLAKADQFTDDLADKPGFNLGCNLVQLGICGGLSQVGKSVFDDNGRRDIDWVPALFISMSLAWIHTQYWSEGGQNSKDALLEQGLETEGCFSIFVIPI